MNETSLPPKDPVVVVVVAVSGIGIGWDHWDDSGTGNVELLGCDAMLLPLSANY